MTYAPEAVVYHSRALSLRSFWQQHFNYGAGAFHFREARASRDQEPIKLEPPSFYMDLLLYPFRHLKTGRALQVAFLLLVSQAANAMGFLWERWN